MVLVTDDPGPVIDGVQQMRGQGIEYETCMPPSKVVIPTHNRTILSVGHSARFRQGDGSFGLPAEAWVGGCEELGRNTDSGTSRRLGHSRRPAPQVMPKAGRSQSSSRPRAGQQRPARSKAIKSWIS